MNGVEIKPLRDFLNQNIRKQKSLLFRFINKFPVFKKKRTFFKFFLKDSEGVEKQVVLAKAKPQDIERAESIVLTGSLKDDVFYAD